MTPGIRDETIATAPEAAWWAVRWVRVPPDHPAVAGHFPGFPVIPGVWLLDEALDLLGEAARASAWATSIPQAKFLHPVPPDVELLVALDLSDAWSHRVPWTASFAIRQGARLLAHGQLSIGEAGP